MLYILPFRYTIIVKSKLQAFYIKYVFEINMNLLPDKSGMYFLKLCILLSLIKDLKRLSKYYKFSL